MYNLRLGTRGSRLALWQAEYVAEEIHRVVPDINIDIKNIKTKGDKILDVALSRIGDKGLFTNEIENELLDGNIDIAVHSLKDLPSVLPNGLCVGAVLKRENPVDVLISNKGYKFADLPTGAILGTSSLRRIAQIKRKRPDIIIMEIRGNVETRLRKMEEEKLDGIVVACAGVTRLGLADRISDYLSPDVILPAVGQGAIAVETRCDDSAIRSLLEKINDETTMIEILAERAFLQELQGGCQVPLGSLARLHGDHVQITGLIASLDGREVYSESATGYYADAEELGRQLAIRLIKQGADRILAEIKTMGEQR